MTPGGPAGGQQADLQTGSSESPAAVEHSGQVRMAYRLTERYGNRLLHAHGLGWFWWDGARWALDDTGWARRAVLDVLKSSLAASLHDKALRRDVQRCESGQVSQVCWKSPRRYRRSRCRFAISTVIRICSTMPGAQRICGRLKRARIRPLTA
jgi:hypothetical protein